jgi:hypothetical protein
MILGLVQEPSVDLRDYRIRITGVHPETTDHALWKCGATRPDNGPKNIVRVRHYFFSTIVHFYSTCDPRFVDDVTFALLEELCPNINDGLLEAFGKVFNETEQLQAIA